MAKRGVDLLRGHVGLHEGSETLLGEYATVEADRGEDVTGGTEEFVAADTETDLLDTGFDGVDECRRGFE